MTNTHPGAPTNPLRLGPPGDRHGEVPLLHPVDIHEELARAGYELLFAAARHRKAWAVARQLKDKIAGEGGWPDGDATYKKATSDVRWWREEMTAQATAVSALHTMLESRQPTQERVPAFIDPGKTTIFGWPVDEEQCPTKSQYSTAVAWVGKPPQGPHPVVMLDAIYTLINTYERFHPEARDARRNA